MTQRRRYNPPIGTEMFPGTAAMKIKIGPDIDDWEYTDRVTLSVSKGRALLPCETVVHLDGDPNNNDVDNLDVNSEEC
jgi:hypothetical protein